MRVTRSRRSSLPLLVCCCWWLCLGGWRIGGAQAAFVESIRTDPVQPFLVGSNFTVEYDLNLQAGVQGHISFVLDQGAVYRPGSLTKVFGPPDLECLANEEACVYWAGSYSGPARVSRALQNLPDVTSVTLWYGHPEGSSIYRVVSEYRVSLEASMWSSSHASASSFEQGEVLEFSANMTNEGPSNASFGTCLMAVEPEGAGVWVEGELSPSCQMLSEQLVQCTFENIPASSSVEFVSGLKLATNFFFPSDLTVSLFNCSAVWYTSMRIIGMNYTHETQHFNVIPSPSQSTSSSSSSSAASSQEYRGDREEESEDKTPVIAGASVGGVVLLLLLLAVSIAAFTVWKQRKRRNRFTDQRDLENGAEDVYAMKKDFVASSTSREMKVRVDRTHSLDNEGMSWEISWRELELAEQIGDGAFGTVWRGHWRNSEVAIKQLSGLESEKSVEAFKAEVELMKRLRPHANVVLLMGACMEEGHPFCLVTEFLPKGDLLRFLQSKEGKKAMKDEKTLLRMAREIAAGMSHLHAEGITHRDLAARNLLLGKDLTIKVSDFGLAHKQEKGGEEERQLDEDAQVPVKWLAPEVLKSNTYGPAADVWSYGVTLWEMANSGMEPYPGMSMEEASLAVLDGKHPDIPSSLPSILQNIMEECFAVDPEERPSFASIVNRLKRGD
ncbi:Tyrosine-protein kinase abl1 [Balamuthia mandrillaris]